MMIRKRKHYGDHNDNNNDYNWQFNFVVVLLNMFDGNEHKKDTRNKLRLVMTRKTRTTDDRCASKSGERRLYLKSSKSKRISPLFFRVFFFSNNIINWPQKYFRPTERLLLLVSRTQRWIKTNRGRLIQVLPPRIVCLGRGWIEMPVGHGNNTEGLCSLAHSWTLGARTRTHKCSCGGHAHN